jgi:hypothetical protein
MKLKLAALILPVAALGLAACADDGYAYNHGGGHHRSAIYYDGYYDDFYGPVYGGYWAGDNYWYQTRRGAPYVVDSQRHFRREQFERAHAFHHRDRGDHPH